MIGSKVWITKFIHLRNRYDVILCIVVHYIFIRNFLHCKKYSSSDILLFNHKKIIKNKMKEKISFSEYIPLKFLSNYTLITYIKISV